MKKSSNMTEETLLVKVGDDGIEKKSIRKLIRDGGAT